MSVRYTYWLQSLTEIKKTFVFIVKAGLRIVGSKYCFTTTPASHMMDWSEAE